ncbi:MULTISPECIES: MATE family efflux transporter [Gluconobacter]|uniref:Multidrug-efflux transporter n=1 Tax=Gluconobacter cerinus TaxID=38307 RepID=A0AAV5NE82_9PROT|nr:MULTISPECIES: MATE family efflux transporter [Gluconobacter]GLQ62450.1 putative multidrug resistance protein NorM [Gluconobacter cerinus]
MCRTFKDPTSSRGHALALLRVALPLALSQLSEMSMGVTDTILLGGLGVAEVAVGGLANTFFFTTMVTCQTILGGAGVLLSHSRGAEDHGRDSHDGRSVMSAAFVLALLIFIPCALLLWFVQPLFAWLAEPGDVVTQGSHFIHILLLSLLPDLAVIGVLRVALPSLGAETLLLWIMPAMALCNGITNAALIHGWFGLPAMGMYGSATATTLTGWAISFALTGLCLMHPRVRAVMKPAPVRWPIMKELLKLGLPMMMGAAAEILMFQITSLRAGQLGTQSLAAHQVAVNVSALLFMVCLAIGQATNVRVAYWRGSGRMDQSRRAAWTGIWVVLVWSILSSALLLIWPEKIVSLYFTGHAPDPSTAALVITLMKIAGIYQIVDGLQVVFSGALRGCGDAVWPMVIAVTNYGLIGLVFGGWLAFQQHWGAEGLWVGMAAALTVSSVALGIRLFSVMRKAEPVPS